MKSTVESKSQQKSNLLKMETIKEESDNSNDNQRSSYKPREETKLQSNHQKTFSTDSGKIPLNIAFHKPQI